MSGCLLGVDEAGYGPKLGPLVVAAYGVSLPGADEESLTRAAASVDAVLRDAGVTDSKQVYRGADTFDRLERIALGLLETAQSFDLPASLGRIWHKVVCGPPPGRCERAFGNWDRLQLPVTASAAEIRTWCQGVRRGLDACGVEACLVVARVVFPAEFNEIVKSAGSKNVALSRWTAELLRALSVDHRGAAKVVLDRQGGRKNYAQLLWACSDTWREVVCLPGERWLARGPAGTLEVQPKTKADRTCALTSAASIVAKYLRELFMLLWNDFWRERVPGLRPTAGYPQDAARFWREIEPLVGQLRLQPAWLLRTR